jgi:hypothetical protein
MAPATCRPGWPNTNLLTIKTRGEDGVLRYTTKGEAVDAFKQLGFRVNVH